VCVCVCVCVCARARVCVIESVRKESELEFSFRSPKYAQNFLLITLTDQLTHLPILQNEQLQLFIYSKPFLSTDKIKTYEVVRKTASKTMLIFWCVCKIIYKKKKEYPLASPSVVIYLSDRNDM